MTKKKDGAQLLLSYQNFKTAEYIFSQDEMGYYRMNEAVVPVS